MEPAQGVYRLRPLVFVSAERISRFLVQEAPNSDQIRQFCAKQTLFRKPFFSDVVQSDIKTYLETELKALNLEPVTLDELVDRSGVLFIYASTVVRYVRHKSIARSNERLKHILSAQPILVGAIYRDINSLYDTILTAALYNKANEMEQEETRLALRAVICAQEPLSVKALAQLLGLEVELLRDSLQPLLSVLQISDGAELVTTLHESFPDYLLDPRRAGEFYCDAGRQHLWLARTCFNIIEITQPSFNICDLESSYILDADAPDFNRRVESSIPEHLFYACRYWEAHLELAESSNKLLEELVRFLSIRLVMWVEIMNLKQNSHTSVIMLSKLDRWLPVRSVNIHIQE
ncbi:hypothetical protein FRC09_007487 [Ceratobasidium sp. 395]|nr:hypothetical protein FRC09_007487 [Ceratobasidium sp. 395]